MDRVKSEISRCLDERGWFLNHLAAKLDVLDKCCKIQIAGITPANISRRKSTAISPKAVVERVEAYRRENSERSEAAS